MYRRPRERLHEKTNTDFPSFQHESRLVLACQPKPTWWEGKEGVLRPVPTSAYSAFYVCVFGAGYGLYLIESAHP